MWIILVNKEEILRGQCFWEALKMYSHFLQCFFSEFPRKMCYLGIIDDVHPYGTERTVEKS